MGIQSHCLKTFYLFAGYVHNCSNGPDLRGLGIPLLLRPHPGVSLIKLNFYVVDASTW